METIDEIGRRAAQAALAEAATYVDVEAGLARVTADADVELDTSAGGRRLWVVLVAAAVIAAVAAGVVWARHEPSSRLVPGSRPDVTPAPTPPPTEPAPAPPAGLSVNYLDPPPALEPAVFARLEASAEDRPPFAVTDSGGAVTIDNEAGEAIIVDLDGSARRVPIESRAFVVAAGPGDVLYAIEQGTAAGLRVVAIALSGERVGQVVAQYGLDTSLYTDLPLGSFGHGSEGVVLRTWIAGAEIIGHVDEAGRPLRWDDAPAVFTVDQQVPDTVLGVTSPLDWRLDIERHPDYIAPASGESPPAPNADGGAVYWTGIGTPDDPINVIAELAPDGSGQWYRLPDGWTVAASDVWGTILTRRVGDQIELATLAPTSQNVPPTTAAPTTVPSTTAQRSPVEELAEAIGASQLITREPSTITVFADGETTEVTTPPDAYVQTDGSFLWWNTVNADGAVRSAAATLDGTIVCDVDGVLHRIRVDPDGGYVASVEEANNASGEGAETPVPNFAVDCETGARQPIETVRWTREGGGRQVERIGDRTFTHVSDAEGNADVTNESGVSVNGEDYAGYHEFNDDGSRVVYGDMDNSVSPHWTNVVRSRDTTTGEVLWTTDLGRPVGLLHWYAQRVLAPVLSDGGASLTPEAVIVLDAATGAVVTTVPTSLDIAFVD